MANNVCLWCGGKVGQDCACKKGYRWQCHATETIYHSWEVEAATREEAMNIALDGCPNDCETNGQAHFGDINLEQLEEVTLND